MTRRVALKRTDEREASLLALRNALAEGEDSGPSVPFDFNPFLSRKRSSRQAAR
jgi:antitoxin ParD1/3/4